MNTFYENIDLSKSMNIRNKFKNFELFTYTITDNKVTITPINNPPPIIEIVSSELQPDLGGGIQVSDVILRAVPSRRYSEEYLLGVGSNRRLWVIRGPAFETKGYVTKSVVLENPIFFKVVLTRYKSLNSAKLNKSLSDNGF